MRRGVVLLVVAACGRLDFEVRDAGGTTELAIESPADGAIVGATAVLVGSCVGTAPITLSGDLIAPPSTPCAAGTFSAAVTFTAGDGDKRITLTQGARMVTRRLVRLTSTIAFRAAASATQPSVGFTVDCTLTIPAPPGVTAGDVIVGVIHTDGGPAGNVATPGWNRVPPTSPSSAVVYKLAGTEPASYAFPITAGTGPEDTCESAGALAAFSGASLTTPIGAAAITPPADTASLVAPSVTAAAAGLLVVAFGSNGPATGITTPAGTTIDASASPSFAFSANDWANAKLAWQPVLAGATGARTATLTEARGSVAAALVLQP